VTFLIVESGGIQLVMSTFNRSKSYLQTIAILLLLVTVTALAVVYSSFNTRQLFIQLQALQAQAAAQQVTQGRLLLESSAWSSLASVENAARNQLSMREPSAQQLVVATIDARTAH
jgi:cell division protein FtsL